MKFKRLCPAVLLIVSVAVIAQVQPPKADGGINPPDAIPTPPTPIPAVENQPWSPAVAAPQVPEPQTTNILGTTSNISVEAGEKEFVALPTKSISDDQPDNVGTDSTTNTAPNENLINISLDDVALADVVRMFSHISNANIIATPSNLTEHVSATLNGVEWKPALSTILSMHNLSLTEKPAGSGVYRIEPRAPNAPEPLKVETVFLKYTTVNEVTPVVSSMLPERGSISTFSSRNALVIRSTADNISEIKSVINKIDIESKQICIEALFMELSDSAMKQLGIRWDSLAEFKVGAKVGPFAYKDESTRTKTRTDQLNQYNNRTFNDSLSRKFDEYGAPIIGEPSRTISDSVDQGRLSSSDIKDEFSRTISDTKAAILNVDTLNIVLSALKQTEGVSVVSNPKMIVANGATNAFFRVGEREPITKTTKEQGTTDSPGDSYITELDTGINSDFIKDGYVRTGIDLRVVPTVKTDNLIEALIEPSLRRKVGEKTVKVSDEMYNSWPIISVKEIKTRFTLTSGQTVAIGGLTDTTKNKVVSKVPLLGDIPLLGKYLFSHTKDQKKQVETIIFVTLSIANPHHIQHDAAIPDHARLVQKRMLQDKLDKANLDQQLRKLQAATDRQLNSLEDASVPKTKKEKIEVKRAQKELNAAFKNVP